VISLEDCLALCGLTEQEVLALAEHEHVPEIAAAALGPYLINQPKGLPDHARHARREYRWTCQRGDERHAMEPAATLQHFINSHSELAHWCE
jgi:hypothetical protein